MVVLITLGGWALPTECQAQERLRRVFGLVNGIMQAVNEAEQRQAQQVEIAPLPRSAQQLPNYDAFGLQRPVDRQPPVQLTRRQIDPRQQFNDYGLYRPDDRREFAGDSRGGVVIDSPGRPIVDPRLQSGSNYYRFQDPRLQGGSNYYRPQDPRQRQQPSPYYVQSRSDLRPTHSHIGHGHGHVVQPVIEYPRHYKQICSCTEQLRQQVQVFRQKLLFFQYFPEYRAMDCVAQDLIKLSFKADALGQQGPGAFGALRQTLCQMDELAEQLCRLADKLEDRTDDGRDRQADRLAEHLEEAADNIEDITDDLRSYAP